MSDQVCHAILNLRLRHRLELKRYVVALRESDSIIRDANLQVDGLSGAPNATVANDIAQSKALLETIDKGVGKLMAAILRTDETLAILSEQ